MPVNQGAEFHGHKFAFFYSIVMAISLKHHSTSGITDVILPVSQSLHT